MRSLLYSVALLTTAACSTSFQHVEVDAPANARVVILEGVGTPRIETKTPFSANFEAVSVSDWAAYDLTLDLDATEAARYGGHGPITLYGHLGVGPPTELSRTLTVKLQMPEEKLTALVTGNRVEIETFITDPNANPPRELARLTLRRSPF